MNNDMDKEILAKIKEQLLTEREQVRSELAKLGGDAEGHAGVFPEYGDKPDENAQEIDSYTTNLATERILVDNLRDIDSALKRIEDGTYGVCKYCGEPINPKRLLARPVASACIECKSKLQGAQ